MTISRRDFVAGTVTLATTVLATRALHANPLGLPLGIQLYSVRTRMIEDFDATLAAVHAAGYSEVEAAALPKKPAKEIRASLDKAGLKCVSAHHSLADMRDNFDQTVAFNKEIGVSYIICATPAYRNSASSAVGGRDPQRTLDDWKYNAEQFNLIGEKTGTMGITFGYHNHTPEFTPTEGKIPYLELLQNTDASKVTFELDCGWAIVGGMNPVEILRDHPHRISMLHVKDFKMPDTPPASGHRGGKVTELGLGSIDYRPIFEQAAKTQTIRHAFVEQEGFDMPWQDSLKVDAEYMRKLKG
jgi:sugar phosphate isomerase/epimerase